MFAFSILRQLGCAELGNRTTTSKRLFGREYRQSKSHRNYINERNIGETSIKSHTGLSADSADPSGRPRSRIRLYPRCTAQTNLRYKMSSNRLEKRDPSELSARYTPGEPQHDWEGEERYQFIASNFISLRHLKTLSERSKASTADRVVRHIAKKANSEL